MKTLSVAVLAIVLGFAAVPASAVGIRYTLSGTATGSLGGIPFSARAFTVNLETDTDYVNPWSGDGVSSYVFFGPGASDPERPATIQIDGLPLATFTTTWVELFLAQAYAAPYGNPLLAFGRPNSRVALPGWSLMFASGLTGVSLASEFTAVNAGPTICGGSDASNLFTDQGTLRVNTPCGATLHSITAQFVPAVVPVPAAAWLMGGALGLLAGLRRAASLS